MTYYLLLNGSHVEIGEESFGKFWPSEGLKALYLYKVPKVEKF